MIYQYLDKVPEFAVPFNGWVADSARVIGDVYLGHQASVWFGAVMGLVFLSVNNQQPYIYFQF